MGFLSGLSGIFGGGQQTNTQGSAQSGFSLLPSQIQGAYTNYANAVNSQIPNATSAYTPIGQTAGETQAYNAIDKGFAPDQQTLNSDVSMLMNPFNSSVIDQINRQANGQNSILNQATTNAGQYGSNRQILGANDIENSRQSNIGSLLQNQYNTALGQVFNNLIPQQQQDALNQLGAGASQRNLALQQSSAPITGLQQIGSALSNLPNNGGSTQQNSTNSSQSTNGTLGNLITTGGGILNTIGGLF